VSDLAQQTLDRGSRVDRYFSDDAREFLDAVTAHGPRGVAGPR
jgi:hypothetical protein